MHLQTEITWRMRKTLLLWLVQVTQEFQLHQDSFYLAVNLIDRVISKVVISSKQFQLLGLTCLWVGAKSYENHGGVPGVGKLVKMCCGTYSAQDYIAMERFILVQLGFYLQHVSAEEFIGLYSNLLNLDDLTVSLARYFVELTIFHKRFTGLRPSCIARAAINLSSRFLTHSYLLIQDENDSICQANIKDCLRQQPALLVRKYDNEQFSYSSRVVSHYSTQDIQQNGMLTPPKD